MLGLGLGLVASSAILTEGAMRCGAVRSDFFLLLLQANFLLCFRTIFCAPKKCGGLCMPRRCWLPAATRSLLWPALAAHACLVGLRIGVSYLLMRNEMKL